MDPHTAHDGDGHVIECDETFSEPFLDGAYQHRRPRVVETNGALQWFVDSTLIPGLYGRDRTFVGSPASRQGQRLDGVLQKQESLACLEMTDPADRLALMDEEGIGLSVIYPTLFLVRPLSWDQGFEHALCRAYNSWIASRCAMAGAHGRLHWVAVVDLHDPVGAAAELERCKGMGACGVMIPGMVDTGSVTDPRVEPFWEAAAGLDLAVGVHVAFCTPLASKAFVYSLLMGFEQIVPSGLFDRYPDLRVAFLEASCMWVPFLMERLEERAHPERTAMRVNSRRPRDTVLDSFELAGYESRLSPREYVQRGNLSFGFEVEDPLLPYCVEQFGERAFLWGSDIPHADRLAHGPAVLRKRPDLPETAKQAMLVDNTLRFYALEAPA